MRVMAYPSGKNAMRPGRGESDEPRAAALGNVCKVKGSVGHCRPGGRDTLGMLKSLKNKSQLLECEKYGRSCLFG